MADDATDGLWEMIPTAALWQTLLMNRFKENTIRVIRLLVPSRQNAPIHIPNGSGYPARLFTQ